MPVSADSVASLIARWPKARGVERVFHPWGGHIMPIWMRLDAGGIAIVDVRDGDIVVAVWTTGDGPGVHRRASPGFTPARPPRAAWRRSRSRPAIST